MDIEKKHLDYIGEKYRLTDREKDIVRLIFMGFSTNEDMANEMNIATGTVKIHINSICKKVNSGYKHELIAKFLNDFEIKLKDNNNAKKILASKKPRNNTI